METFVFKQRFKGNSNFILRFYTYGISLEISDQASAPAIAVIEAHYFSELAGCCCKKLIFIVWNILVFRKLFYIKEIISKLLVITSLKVSVTLRAQRRQKFRLKFIGIIGRLI